MYAKFALVVISLGACACTLLAFRQSRLQVASELTQTQLRINAADERLWLLRARIGAEVSPDRIEDMATELGELRPLAEAPLPPAPPKEVKPAAAKLAASPAKSTTSKPAKPKTGKPKPATER